MINVFVYDDSEDRRDGIKALLSISEDIKLVGEAANCSNVIADMKRTMPDVVLMDINMPVVDGIDGLKKIKTSFPEIKILMQTVLDDSEKIFICIKNGASGYILKSDKSTRFIQAIYDVYNGGAVMSPDIAQKVLDYFQPIVKNEDDRLSKRENEVLELLADGLSYKMVAEKLSVSYATVNSHIKRIYEKLHVSSLGEVIAYFYKNKYKSE